MRLLCSLLLAPISLMTAAEIVATASLKALEANQAAAADTRFVYAINNSSIAKYDRESGQRLAISTGPAHHLNSGFFSDGRLYCAHSNFPQKPEKSEIMVLEPATMILSTFHDFGESNGSLTWCVREGDFWWCTFAFYGADNAKTHLVKYDAAWKIAGDWTYPKEVIDDLGNKSISGAVWRRDQLFAIGHDKRVIYRLKVPAQGKVLELVDTIPCPFPGQGIANDPKTGGLIGIERKERSVVFGELRE